MKETVLQVSFVIFKQEMVLGMEDNDENKRNGFKK